MSADDVGPRSLTQVERNLVLHVERGDILDLAGGEPADNEAMRAWGESRTIRAEVLRDILRGRFAPDPDPRGLRLRGARIAGRVDLDDLTTTLGVMLKDCFLGEGLTARYSHLVSLDLSDCLLEHSTEVAMDATGMAASHFVADHATVIARNKRGAIRLYDARIDGHVRCRGATLSNSSGPALDAGSLLAERGVVLDGGFSATGAGSKGAVRLFGARIGADLDCRGATLSNSSGPALDAESVQVERVVFLDDGFSATGAGNKGAVRLFSARIGADLDCNGATLSNSSGPALDAGSLQVEQAVRLEKGFSATGSGRWGTVVLGSAQIGDRLSCAGATLSNSSGPALDAGNLRVEGSVFLGNGFSATGDGAVGTIVLHDARIGADLDCHGATLSNSSGPALDAESLLVERVVFLRTDFSATGAGSKGAVRLFGARIGADLDCRGATLSNSSGPALQAAKAQVANSMRLDEGFSATGAGDDVVLDLSNAQAGGELWLGNAKIRHGSDPRDRLRVDGLAYAGLPRGVSTDSWLRLLREATPAYAAQPYQQLAAAHRALGHDQEARRVLIRQRRDQIQRHALTGRTERAWARLTGVVLGYGYQPWRALVGLLVTLGIAAIVSVVLGSHGALARVNTPPDPVPVNCTVVERIGVGLDLGTPLVSIGARARCDTTRTSTGQALTVAGWGMRLLAWAFATLFIAGFTGAVRKT